MVLVAVAVKLIHQKIYSVCLLKLIRLWLMIQIVKLIWMVLLKNANGVNVWIIRVVMV